MRLLITFLCVNFIDSNILNIDTCLQEPCFASHSSKYIDVWTKNETPFRLWNLWTSHEIIIICHKICEFSVGTSPSYVVEQVSKSKSWINSLLSLTRPSPPNIQRLSLPSHSQAFIGVFGDDSYSLIYRYKYIHPIYIASLAAGFLLLYDSDPLSRSWITHYLVGVTTGVIGVSLFLSYFVLKPIPNSYVFIAGKITVGTFLGTYVWSSLMSRVFVQAYWRYIIIYLLLVGGGSAGYLYYRGPIQSPRVIDLFRLGIQICGLYLMFCSANCVIGSVLMVVLSVTSFIFPWRLVLSFFANMVFSMGGGKGEGECCEVCNPIEGRLVSKEEHRLEIVRNNKEGMASLREYCRSLPSEECWRLINSMTEPSKMASFVMGEDDICTDFYKYDVI